MHPVIAPLAAACSSLGGVLVSARSMILPLSTCSWGTARIAYDRRLALALGMTADEVDFGVLLFWDPRSGAWTYTNGAGRSVRVFGVDDAGIPAQSPHIPCTQHADPLLVRALMWPADKRVRG